MKMIYKASQRISLIEQLQHPFRVGSFWDRLIPNCGCHSNQSFPYSYYNRDVNNFLISSVLPWVHALKTYIPSVKRKYTKMLTCFIKKGWTSAPSVCNYKYIPLSHLGVLTCVMGVETTTTGFINRCHYRSFLRQTC